MMRTTKGFTLIELLIAIAIIGILASVAISAFRDYSIRTKVSEGLGVSHAAKIAVSETYDSEGRFLAASNASYGLPQSTSIVGNYVSSVAVGTSGIITITYNDRLGGIPSADNRTIVLNPLPRQGSIQWNCTGGTQLSKYRPSECRP
jgi:type IV pilus assembly protein PilA